MANADCAAVTTYNEGLLIGSLVTMDQLRRRRATHAEPVVIDSSGLDFMRLAIKAFNVTLEHLQEGGEGWVSDGPAVKSMSCGDTDIFWFRGIFFWNALKLHLHLRRLGPEHAADAAMVAEAITNNWLHVKKVLHYPTGLSPNNWFGERRGGVGCFKTQMSLYWLALAQRGVESPDAAAEALLL